MTKKPSSKKGVARPEPSLKKRVARSKPSSKKGDARSKPSSKKGDARSKPSSKKGDARSKPSSKTGDAGQKLASKRGSAGQKLASKRGVARPEPSSKRGVARQKPAAFKAAALAAPRAKPSLVEREDARFTEVIALIEAARGRAYQAVNAELVSLYWKLGEYISRKIASAEWGDGVVDELASSLARRFAGIRGFTRRNLFRMRQFFEAYRGHKKVSPLVTQLSWTHHLIILSEARPVETREFYILAAIKERWSKRELERQIRSGAVLRSSSLSKRVSPVVTQIHPTALDEFKNAYNFEFLALPDVYSEADLHGALLHRLGRFLTELGRDFCFVGSQYPVQVGNQDFAIDLVFFHRGLQCLVAIELKTEKFKPADLGQLSFYVEALDRDVKKPHERPSIGLLLCATKDDEVVEYALARSTSPTLVAEYQTVLPPKELLRAKLHELYAMLTPDDDAVAVERSARKRRR
nr:PDDEXK nuclease domain-containing protein [Chondromyces crocatus]